MGFDDTNNPQGRKGNELLLVYSSFPTDSPRKLRDADVKEIEANFIQINPNYFTSCVILSTSQLNVCNWAPGRGLAWGLVSNPARSASRFHSFLLSGGKVSLF